MASIDYSYEDPVKRLVHFINLGKKYPTNKHGDCYMLSYSGVHLIFEEAKPDPKQEQAELEHLKGLIVEES